MSGNASSRNHDFPLPPWFRGKYQHLKERLSLSYIFQGKKGTSDLIVFAVVCLLYHNKWPNTRYPPPPFTGENNAIQKRLPPLSHFPSVFSRLERALLAVRLPLFFTKKARLEKTFPFRHPIFFQRERVDFEATLSRYMHSSERKGQL